MMRTTARRGEIKLRQASVGRSIPSPCSTGNLARRACPLLMMRVSNTNNPLRPWTGNVGFETAPANIPSWMPGPFVLFFLFPFSPLSVAPIFPRAVSPPFINKPTSGDLDEGAKREKSPPLNRRQGLVISRLLECGLPTWPIRATSGPSRGSLILPRGHG